MDKEKYILNEVGLEIARENIANKMREMMESKTITDEENFKKLLGKLLRDREEIENGNIEVIKKYVGEIKYE